MICKLLFLPAIALAACAPGIAGPHPSLDGLPDGLEVSFTVEPAEVSQHQPFSASLSVTNATSHVIQVVTSHGCLALPSVLRDGERVPFEGTALGCHTAITTHTFAPGETWSQTWEMRAELYAEYPGEVDGVPAPSGSYVVQARFDTWPPPKPVVEKPLLVQ